MINLNVPNYVPVNADSVVYKALKLLESYINKSVIIATAGEALSVNDLVYLYDNAGVLTAKKAQSGVTVPTGYCKLPVANGSTFEVYLPTVLPIVESYSGLTLGAAYYLSAATAGAITTIVTADKVGIALSSTTIYFKF